MQTKIKRKSKGPTFRVYVASSFPDPIYQEIERLAKEFSIGKAEVVRALSLRGLKAYRNDGVLKDENNVDLPYSTTDAGNRNDFEDQGLLEMS